MIGPVLVAALATLTVGALAPLGLRPALRRLGATDVPQARSSHRRPVLRGAGIALAAATSVGAVVLGVSGQEVFVSTATAIMAGVACAAVGAVEDVRHISVRARLLCQLVIGVLAGLALGFREPTMLLVALVLCATAVPVLVNVTNFMDGVDNLSSFSSIVVGAHFVAIGLLHDLAAVSAVGAILMAAAAAFIPWNNGPHKMFLGDSGSYLLGGVVALGTVLAVLGSVPVVTVAAAVAIQLADTGTTLVLRARRGDRISESHRQHRYHLLEDRGLNHVTVAGIVTVAIAVCCTLGLVFDGTGPTVRAIVAGGIVLACAAYVALPLVRARRRPGLMAGRDD